MSDYGNTDARVGNLIRTPAVSGGPPERRAALPAIGPGPKTGYHDRPVGRLGTIKPPNPKVGK